QRVALVLLEVGQRERGVPVELDGVAVEHERLAGRALSFLAAVHEHDALLEGGAQDRLFLADFDLDADGLEAHHVLVAHDSLGGCVLTSPGGRGRRPAWPGTGGWMGTGLPGRAAAMAPARPGCPGSALRRC